MAKKKTPDAAESVVIYWSAEDNCWIAHSLYMDQIGTGRRVVDALADLIKAMNAVLREAMADPTLSAKFDELDKDQSGSLSTTELTSGAEKGKDK